MATKKKSAKAQTAQKATPRSPKGATTPKRAAASRRPVKVAKAEGAAPVKAYIAKLPAWQARLLRQFDDLVSQEVPHAARAVKWSAPFYGVPGQGWFASTKGFSKHVKLTFFRGAQLDPVPPSGEHDQGRSLDLREGDALDARVVSSWIRQAAALPGWGSS